MANPGLYMSPHESLQSHTPPLFARSSENPIRLALTPHVN